MPAASTVKSGEREFVVDSRASLHMVSKRDLNSAELETVRTSRSPTTVMTANGEVQTREEATENVEQLDLVVNVMLLQETPAVLSIGLRRSPEKLPLDQWSETKSHQKWQEDRLQYGERRTIRCPWSIDKLYKLILTYISYILIAGSRNSYRASRINKW